MSSRQRVPQAQAGFTIVELLVATMIFGMIMVVITAGVISFTASYYKGINTSATQNATRKTMNILAQNLEYGGGKQMLQAGSPDGNNKSYCAGDTIVAYNLGAQLGVDSQYGVFVATKEPSDGATCRIYSALTAAQRDAGQELLSPNMRVTQLDVSGSGLYSIKASVAYGDIDLLCSTTLTGGAGGCSRNDAQLQPTELITNGATIGCKLTTGAQFCAAAHLSTEVASRFKSTSP